MLKIFFLAKQDGTWYCVSTMKNVEPWQAQRMALKADLIAVDQVTGKIVDLDTVE